MSAFPSLTGLLQANNNRSNVEPFVPATGNDLAVTNVPSSGTIRVSERGEAHIRQITVEVINVPISVTDGATSGAGGGIKLFDFPAYVNTVLSGVARLSTNVTAGLTNAIKYGVGSTITDATDNLSSTRANVIPSSSITIASSTGSATSAVYTATPVVLDGRSSAQSLFLNFGVIDANATTAAHTVTVTGVLIFNVLSTPSIGA